MTTNQKIPQSFIDDLIVKTDLVEWICERISLKRSGSNWHGKCPFHDEKSPSFSVSQTKQFYYCFGCKASGNIIQFLMDYHHYTFLEAIEHLASTHGMPIPTQVTQTSPQGEHQQYELMQAIAKHYQNNLAQTPEASAYLHSRKLSEETIKAFQLGYAPNAWQFIIKHFGKDPKTKKQLHTIGMAIQKNDRSYDRFRERIMFPIHNHKGQVIAFGGRVLGEGTPKYLNSPETPLFHKSKSLFGLHHVKSTQGKLDKILIVEGYMDVIALANHGIHYAVATLGTAITGDHLKILLRQSKTLIFCFDADLPGHGAAWKALATALPHTHDGTHISFCFLPDGEDPDSFINQVGKEKFEHFLNLAAPLSDTFFRELSKRHPQDSLDAKAALAHQANKYLETMPEGIFKTLLLNKLSDIIQLPSQSLQQKKTSNHTTLSPPAHNRPSSSKKPSAIRKAITLLVQNPQIATSIDLNQFQNDSSPGISHLVAILKLLQQHSSIKNTGTLLQHITDPTLLKQVTHLASLTLITSPDEASTQCNALIKQHQKSQAKITIAALIDKTSRNELNLDEKAQLQKLIAAEKNQN